MRRLLVLAAIALFVIGVVLYSTGRVAEGVVLWLASAAVVNVVFMIGGFADRRLRQAERRARKAGILGIATVMEVRRNGRFHDGSAYYDHTLSVELPGREPYVAVHESTAWGYLTVGRVTQVRVAADDPQRIWIEYDPSFWARSRM
ncbi:hypothetical protein [Nocardioides speluncae]|uniref:hypothetical protein n=1 Tax=Nocardioides speluncae TaxID=2670337 RepID=UPI000D68B3BD|nr:hypothetical protein [Nocardioides speluncae]